MASLDFVIPPILTNASWQKNKGVVAKILVGKTDVGASLIALEKEVASSGFGKVKPFAGKDLVEFETYRAKTVDELKKAVGKIEGKVQAADVTATAAYGKATDSRLVPKAVAAHIDAIIDELVKFKLVVRTYPDKVATELAALFRKSLATNAAAVSILSIANGAVGKNYTRFMNDLKSVHKKPSLDEFSTVFGDNNSARGLCTNYQVWTNFSAQMPATAKQIFNGDAVASFTSPEMRDVADMKAAPKIKAAIDGGRPEGMIIAEWLNNLAAQAKKAETFNGYVQAAKKAIEAV